VGREAQLPAGKAVLTAHILTEGQMNPATFDFRKPDQAKK
jgi:hypothetical protein